MNEIELENMISLNLYNPTKWCNTRELNSKESNEYLSKFLKLSSLDINNIDDLAGKVTTPIYYLFSYVQDHFFDKEATEISLSVSPDFYDYDEVNFFTKIYFYDEPKDGEGLPLLDGEKMEVKLKFRFNDLFHEDIPILIIKKKYK